MTEHPLPTISSKTPSLRLTDKRGLVIRIGRSFVLRKHPIAFSPLPVVAIIVDLFYRVVAFEGTMSGRSAGRALTRLLPSVSASRTSRSWILRVFRRILQRVEGFGRVVVEGIDDVRGSSGGVGGS